MAKRSDALEAAAGPSLLHCHRSSLPEATRPVLVFKKLVTLAVPDWARMALAAPSVLSLLSEAHNSQACTVFALLWALKSLKGNT